MQLSTNYPKPNKGKIVVWGFMGTAPFGGITWQHFHYLAGFRKLGFDVWYVEDASMRVIYDPVNLYPTMDSYEANVAFLSQQLARIGFEDRWVFRPPWSEELCVGAFSHIDELNRLYKEADAVFNLCFCQEHRDGHENISCRVLLETDPVQNQVLAAVDDERILWEYGKFQYHFTYGENYGADDCLVPITKYKYYSTRPPVITDWWSGADHKPANSALTTVTNWNHKGKDVVWQDQTWAWNKYNEFIKYIDLPARSALDLEMAVGALCPPEDVKEAEQKGWKSLPASLLNDPTAYFKYIQESTGEFTVAKEQYVKPRSGWFSDRSVCYLASGRPVITQATGFEKYIPAGEGLFAFSNPEEALACIDAVASDYRRHAVKALEITHRYFDSEVVLTDMLKQIGLL